MIQLTRALCLGLTLTLFTVAASPAQIIMSVDPVQKIIFIEGSDTGNFDVTDNGDGTFDYTLDYFWGSTGGGFGNVSFNTDELGIDAADLISLEFTSAATAGDAFDTVSINATVVIDGLGVIIGGNTVGPDEILGFGFSVTGTSTQSDLNEITVTSGTNFFTYAGSETVIVPVDGLGDVTVEIEDILTGFIGNTLVRQNGSNFENVEIEEGEFVAIPEPASTAMLIGALSLLALRRKRA